MSAVLRSCRANVCSGIFAAKLKCRSIYTQKMAEKSADYSSANGCETKTPFLIGVAGGTASGKVSMTRVAYMSDLSILFSVKLLRK